MTHKQKFVNATHPNSYVCIISIKLLRPTQVKKETEKK